MIKIHNCKEDADKFNAFCSATSEGYEIQTDRLGYPVPIEYCPWCGAKIGLMKNDNKAEAE